MNSTKKHAGYVAIIGRPNVGKSTLLNKILGKKVSITSCKPQTTRHKILGIKTVGNFQSIYVDTPGIHRGEKKMLNRYMNQAALSVLAEMDAIIFMVAGDIWKKEDEFVLAALAKVTSPVILAINKVDLVPQKGNLLKSIENLNKKRTFAAVIPLSAKDGANVLDLEETVRKLLPVGPFLFDEKQATDRDEKFLVSEIIREKLMRLLGEELPYATSVVIEQVVMKKEVQHVVATIYVERDGQKAIIIGKSGELLKKVGTLARKDMENLFGGKVFLQLWVKVKSNWADDKKILQQFGYGN